MIKETRAITMKNGTVYTRTVEVFDTGEEYYRRGNYQTLKRKVRKFDQMLEEMDRMSNYLDEYDDMARYRDLAFREREYDAF